MKKILTRNINPYKTNFNQYILSQTPKRKHLSQQPRKTPKIRNYVTGAEPNSPDFSAGDFLSFSASTTKSNFPHDGYRVIKSNSISALSETIERYPALSKKMMTASLMINAYPAFIVPPKNATLVDTYLSPKTTSRALKLAVAKELSAILVAQPLFAMELLLHHQLHSLEFPKSLVLLIGGYPVPNSLSQALRVICKDENVDMDLILGYGAAEIDAGLFYAVEQNLIGEWLYHPRSDINCDITNPNKKGFGKLMLSLDGKKQADAGDLAKKEGDAYIIMPDENKLRPEVLRILETWSVDDWKKKTGYLRQSNSNKVYFQLRENYNSTANTNELDFFSFASKFKFSWQEKPQWNYKTNQLNSKENHGDFFNQFHCLDPESIFTRNYFYPTSTDPLLAEEILTPSKLVKTNPKLYEKLKTLVSETIRNALVNEGGVSNKVISNKLAADSLTILRNKNGKPVGLLSFSCKNFEGKLMNIGVHLLPEARGRNILKIHHIISTKRAMKEKKLEDIYRLSKTHSPLALSVEQSMSEVQPNIEVIKSKFDKHIRKHVEKKLLAINQSVKEDDITKQQLDCLNHLINDDFIIPTAKFNEKMVTFENCNAWLDEVDNIEFNIMKLMKLNDNKYKKFSDFKKIDHEFREIFSDETKNIKPFVLEYVKSFIGEKIDDSRYFDTDYFVHRKADPSYNPLQVFDGSVESINKFLKGILNYQNGDIFVFCTYTTKQQLNEFEKKVIKKLPKNSQIYFNSLSRETIEEVNNCVSDTSSIEKTIRSKKINWEQSFCFYGKKTDKKEGALLSEKHTNMIPS